MEEALRCFFAAAPADAGAGLYAAVILAARPGCETNAVEWLENIVRADVDFPTPLMQKYGIEGAVKIRVTPSVVAESPMNSLGATLLLAELYQSQNRMAEAIGVLEEIEELSRDPVLKLSLCELYALEGVWDGVVDRAQNTLVEDDITLETAILYGRALQEKVLHQAAIQVLTDALRRKRGRSKELLCEATYWRAISYEAVGKGSQANKEFQKVYAQAPDLRDVAKRVSTTQAIEALPAVKPERRRHSGASPQEVGEGSYDRRFCGQCGSEILRAAKFCGQCGTPL
jgi:tetratricopeptide (TPR) repeat protein